MFLLRKYGTGTGGDVRIPMIKRGAVDFAVGADWTPATGDVKVSKDGGAAANIATLPTPIVMGNTAMWAFTFTDAELQCKELVVTVCDSAPKAVEDQMFIIETFGHASAKFVCDLTDGVRLGLGALPNASPAANGGMPTVNASNFVAGIAGAKNTLDSLHDLSAAQVENAVLDADVATHHTTDGSAGQRIDEAGTAVPLDPWATGLPGTYGPGSAGKLLSTNLDAAISSRLSAASYVAPDNTDAASAAAGVDSLLARLTATRASLLDSLAHLDADISSRLASAAYTAPDNASIAAIQAKTDNLPASPAASGDVMALDMTQSVPLTNPVQTIGDALNAARAEGFGNWALVGTTLTLFAADGATPVHSFTWNDPDNPTSRS